MIQLLGYSEYGFVLKDVPVEGLMRLDLASVVQDVTHRAIQVSNRTEKMAVDLNFRIATWLLSRGCSHHSRPPRRASLGLVTASATVPCNTGTGAEAVIAPAEESLDGVGDHLCDMFLTHQFRYVLAIRDPSSAICARSHQAAGELTTPGPFHSATSLGNAPGSVFRNFFPFWNCLMSDCVQKIVDTFPL